MRYAKGQTQPVTNWERFRLIPKSARRNQYEPDRCAICQQLIVTGQRYYDGGISKKAHQTCVETERKT